MIGISKFKNVLVFPIVLFGIVLHLFAWNPSISTEVPFTPPTEPIAVNSTAAGDAGDDRYVQLVYYSEFDLWVMVWDSNENVGGVTGDDYDIYFASSADGGRTWSDPALVNTNGETDSGDDVRPTVIQGEGFLWVAWESHENLDGAGADLDILYTRTLTQGQIPFDFVAPRLLNTNAATDSGDDRNVRIAVWGPDEIIAVWESEENLDGTAGTDWDIFYSCFVMGYTDGVSDPALDAWSAPRTLNGNAVGDTGDDLNPDIGFDVHKSAGLRTWIVVWDADQHSDSGPDRDIFFARADYQVDVNDTVFSTEHLLNTTGETDVETDVRPRIGANRDPADEYHPIVVTWASKETLGGTIPADYHIFVATSLDEGASWGNPLVLGAGGKSDRADSFAATSPDIDCATEGYWCAVVWQQIDPSDPTGGDTDIFVSMSNGLMTSWSDPARLASNATTDTGEDRVPVVRSRSDTVWMSAWFSTEDLSGGGGTDSDIFLVRRQRIFGDDFETGSENRWSAVAGVPGR